MNEEFNNEPEYEIQEADSIDVSDDVSVVKETPSALKNDQRYSGECGSCRKRINDVPVIDGAPQCPNCNRI